MTGLVVGGAPDSRWGGKRKGGSPDLDSVGERDGNYPRAHVSRSGPGVKAERDDRRRVERESK